MASGIEKGTCAKCAYFKLYGYLPDLVSRALLNNVLVYRFKDSPSIKDGIEACGIPHTEIEIVLVDGGRVDFTHRLTHNAVFELFPPGIFEGSPWSSHLLQQEPCLNSFILDVHLGKLARKLRLLGFDSVYRNDFEDPEIVKRGVEEGRVILTRDRGILKCSAVTSGLLIRYSNDLDQTHQVLSRYNLWSQISLYKRCVVCNGLMAEVSKESILDNLLPQTRLHCHQFWRCSLCGKIYWRGAHSTKIEHWLEELKMKASEKVKGPSC